MDILGLMRERAGGELCPRCRRPLADCGVTLLKDEAPTYTLEVTCALCSVVFVLVVQVRERRSRRPAAARAPSRPPIGDDELLAVHELLRDHRGTLADLLRAR